MTYSGYPSTYSQNDFPFLAQAGVSPDRAGRKGLGLFSSGSAVMMMVVVVNNKATTSSSQTGTVIL